ncbi:neuronal regeneration-related protein isoform X1 [Trichechus manatus latirostris]|uniref:Neuronal regeneration-related protein n=1 Tax=Trichechus manatus latirostris TaxID=127582 RepID=A0A2Y9QWK0_TRIMA|nr:neuronal regeneration-related protein isoform X1 [Trichechus manatus latirostris]
MVYYPDLFVWVSREPFPNEEMEGRLPKLKGTAEYNTSGNSPRSFSVFGRLPVPKEVNRKKGNETAAACLTPVGGDELCPPRISYLFSF